jgi:hypothetical protein
MDLTDGTVITAGGRIGRGQTAAVDFIIRDGAILPFSPRD